MKTAGGGACVFLFLFCLLPFYFCLISVSVQLRDGALDVLGLREDGVFELRGVGDEGVERGEIILREARR